MPNTVEYNYNNLILSASEYDSRQQLHSCIDRFNRGILLESEPEEANTYMMVKARYIAEEWASYCGLVYYDFGIKPQIASHSDRYCCWIAFGNCLFLVSFYEPKCIAKVELPFVFWDLISLENSSILVIHELGGICYDSKAKQLWEVSGKDKVESYNIKDGQLILKFDDGKTFSHQL
jgi:hypothetical protein